MYNTVCSPPENKYRPQTPVDAMFSLPYSVSTAILTGGVLLEDFSVEAIREPDRLEFANRIEIKVNEGIDRQSKELNLPLALHEIDLLTKELAEEFDLEVWFSALSSNFVGSLITYCY